MDFNSANPLSFTSFPKGSKEPVIIHFLKPSLWSRVNPGLPTRSSLSAFLLSTVNQQNRCTFFGPKIQMVVCKKEANSTCSAKQQN